MIRVALLRHGHTAWNRAGRVQGSTDIALDNAGRAVLAGFALPPEWQQVDLWSSPLQRAVETAAIITGRKARIAPELTEMAWGEWEGLRGKDMAADPASGFRRIEDWGWDYRAPTGESPADVWARLQPWLARLSRDSVVISHMGVMRVLLARAHGWDFDGPAPFAIKRNRLYILTLDRGHLSAEGDPVRLIPREVVP